MVTSATEFASAERSDLNEINRQVRKIARSRLFRQFAKMIKDPVIILNQHRQIVYANPPFSKVLDGFFRGNPIGLRPGEVLLCENAKKGSCGCGTSSSCQYCGAVKAVLSGLRGVEEIAECLITQGGGDTLVFMCHSYPLKVGGEDFAFLSFKDISKETRLRILERIFFHDIKNLLTPFNGLTRMLDKTADPEQSREITRMLIQLGDDLVDEVNAQQQLLNAETNQLATHFTAVNPVTLLQELKLIFEKNDLSDGRKIEISTFDESVTLITDVSLLRRILGNMLRNALEATKNGETVTISCVYEDGCVRFRVHNPGFIPLETQSQIFKWSFSTKGKGRGLGTYSMRLLGERYLKGSVSFTSEPETGTRFEVSMPLV
jgi:hypothetical protein